MALEARDNLTPSRELFENMNKDLETHTKWKKTREEYTRLRLKHNVRRRLPYPGAPNFVVPIIDDVITRTTALQNRVLWGPKYLAFFKPMGPGAYEFKEKAERAFHLLLSALVNVRRTFSMAFDNQNEMGISYLTVTTNDKAYERIYGIKEILPDLEFTHPYDLVFPANTKSLQNSFRYVRIVKYNRDNFRLMGRKLQWRNVEKVLAKAHSKDQDGSETSGYHYRINTQPVEITDDQIVVHEGYYHNKEGQKRFIQYAECLPDDFLKDSPWKWQDSDVERRWPTVDMPREDRAPGLYDSRGLAELSEDNQKAATALKNVQGQVIDYIGIPTTSGGNAMTIGKFLRPGGNLPEGVTINAPPELPQFFGTLMDTERREAARRSGSDSGAISSTQQSKEPITATESNRNAVSSDIIILDNVQRTNDPISTVFSMMWEWLRYNPVELPILNDNSEFEESLSGEVFKLPFIVQASATAKNSDPVFVLNQMLGLLQFANGNPVIEQDILWNHVWSQVDPVLADKIVVDLQAGAPIQQAIEQLGQMVTELQQTVNENRAYISADAEEKEFQDEEEKQLQKVS